MANIVAITSCPTGIAHTFMAAEGLEQGAIKLGHKIKVETQGSVGAQNQLTADDVAAADIVLIAADTSVNLSRFAGKRIYETGTKGAIGDGAAVVQTALQQAVVKSAGKGPSAGLADQALSAKAAQAASRTGAYKHLMTGVSYMIPFVVAGGLLIAIGFALGGIYVYEDAYKGSLAANLFWIGKASFQLMVPILAGYAAFSIADRPGIAPGMIAGVIADSVGAGFLGGIVGGFLAGYIVRWLNQTIKLPRTLEGLKPVLILPLLGATITGLLMYYVVGGPVASILAGISGWLKSMQGSSAIVLGMILGCMMAFDMGGPVNKAAYTFGTGLLASQIYEPMAAIMAAGMTPPLGIALATMLFRNRFSADEREAGKAAAALGISFITEGAIPFAAKDPFRVIPSIMLGSAVAGALSMAVGAQLHHHRRVGGRRDAAGHEQHDRQFASLGHLSYQLVRRLQLLRRHVQLGRIVGERGDQAGDLALDGADVARRLGDVAGACLALRPDHRCTLGDATQRLTQVRGAAHEWHGELPLVDVVHVVGGRQNLRLVDVVHLERLEHLSLDEVPDPGLGHDGNRDGADDAVDEVGVAHASHPTLRPDVGRYPLEGHHGHRARILGDLRLVGVDDVHDDAAFEHLGESTLDAAGAQFFSHDPRF